MAKAGNPTKFVTLTSRRVEGGDPDAAARALVRAWRNIVQRARREGLIDECEYLAVFESTRQGWPHLHILARMGYLDQRWLSERMAEYCDSPVVDIRAVYATGHAAAYIAKYISKGPGRFAGTKRYWRTRRWAEKEAVRPRPVNTVGVTRYRSMDRPSDLAHVYRIHRWDVREDVDGGFEAHRTPEVTWAPSWMSDRQEGERWYPWWQENRASVSRAASP